MSMGEFHSNDSLGILSAMSNSPFIRVFRHFHDQARQATIDLFEASDNPAEAIISAYATAQHNLSPWHQKMIAEYPDHAACRVGCWWCCTKPVKCTIAEVFLIAFTVITTWNKEERSALIQRLKQYRDKVDNLSVARIDNLRLRCPLLVKDRCSVHSVRPMICAGWSSTNAKDCQRGYNERWRAGNSYKIRHILELEFLYTIVDQAIEEIAVKNGLDMRPVNLALALLIALTVDDADEQWIHGVPVFDTALWPEDPGGSI